MSHFDLSEREIRIIGCLMEKSIFTPDVYPLTLNGLTNACNQKSSREPVMSLSTGEVQQVTRALKEKHLVHIDLNFKNGMEKYSQTFCNTNFGDIQLTPPQFAVIALLLLRGAQTPGELRSRSGRFHTFEDNQAVVEVLDGLIAEEHKTLVIKLPRRAGRKDCEYMHLLSGPIDVDAFVAESERAKPASPSPSKVDMAEVMARLTRLESEVAQLKAALGCE